MNKFTLWHLSLTLFSLCKVWFQPLPSGKMRQCFIWWETEIPGLKVEWLLQVGFVSVIPFQAVFTVALPWCWACKTIKVFRKTQSSSWTKRRGRSPGLYGCTGHWWEINNDKVLIWACVATCAHWRTNKYLFSNYEVPTCCSANHTVSYFSNNNNISFF